MRFKENIIREILDPASSSKLTNALAEVTSYDAENNLANIFIKRTSTGEMQELENVPIQLSGGGIHSSPITQGDTVYVQFNNGSVFQPKIVGIADEHYFTSTRKREKHLRKGSLLASQEELNGDIKPCCENWIDSKNKDINKFSNFRYTDPVKNTSKIMHEKGYFVNGEVGLFNPTSSAIVKLQDNGTIDIFTKTNVGVRINPMNRTIEMFGDVSTNSDNWSVLSNNIKIHANDKLLINGNSIEINSKNITINGVQRDDI